MKKEIHPQYFKDTKVTCSCGASFEVGSTVPEIRVEVCSECHPAYTGNKKYMDTTGRLDRFKTRAEKSSKIQAKISEAKAKKAAKIDVPEKEVNERIPS
jgi:large subunit ribosomal protein L31